MLEPFHRRHYHTSAYGATMLCAGKIPCTSHTPEGRFLASLSGHCCRGLLSRFSSPLSPQCCADSCPLQSACRALRRSAEPFSCDRINWTSTSLRWARIRCRESLAWGRSQNIQTFLRSHVDDQACSQYAPQGKPHAAGWSSLSSALPASKFIFS